MNPFGETSAWIVRARLISGLIVFLFVLTHVLNHAALLESVEAAEALRRVLGRPWRTPPGTILLYGALVIHIAMTLVTLFQRHTLILPARQMVQILLGLLIPYMLIEHVVSTRVAASMFGYSPGYAGVVYALRISNPALGVQQAIALMIVWVHGCLGVHFWLRYRPWYSSVSPYLLGLAVVLLMLALIAFANVGPVLAIERRSPYLAESTIDVPLAVQAQLGMIITSMRGGYVMLIVLTLLARQIRLARQSLSAITIRYEHGAVARVAPGTSILEASRMNGIPHYAICGGNGRCSTCRVRILQSAKPLAPPSAAERATLARSKSDPDVRLACQVRPTANIRVAQVLTPPDRLSGDSRVVQVDAARERQVAIMFCDLRQFTSISEQRLPYDVVFLLNRYFALVGQAIEAHGGHVDKFIGDGVMAIFGLDDRPAQEACRNALAAAAQILADIDSLNIDEANDLKTRFRVAIGLHFGIAVVGVMGFGNATGLTAVGDTVNIASRLESSAKEHDAALMVSEALVSEAALGASPGVLENIAIRGRKDPLRCHVCQADGLARALRAPMEPVRA
ncbi:MAG: adenylate/guanylate cyclase domain-containing protein [Rhodobacterales bacterium]|nr:adenylate/guanylate cyclase domain-containing protein [Rhodobacterales bacterium]MDX5498665.1 adenylate/guanylate cyclase domain-containing protein [Rhodobacterales bacterium]